MHPHGFVATEEPSSQWQMGADRHVICFQKIEVRQSTVEVTSGYSLPAVAAKPRSLGSGEAKDTLQKPWLSFPPWELDWALQ